MQADVGKIYVSGEVEIDTGRVVIRCAGEERSLRPKTFRVLVYLVEHRDRLVPKEELIQQLWRDTAVSDGALAQCIADIRRALDEDPRNPRFIRTAPRLGYQFIGPVQDPATQGMLLEEITESRVEYTEEVIEDAPGPLSLPAAPEPRDWRWAVQLSALCILLTGAGVAGWRHWTQPLPGSADPGIRTAIFPFENRSGDQKMDWLRAGLADMLATSLSGSPRVALVTPGQLQRGLRSPGDGTITREDALRAARKAGAKAMILGAFGVLGETVRLDTQVYEVETGRLVGGESLTVDRPGLLLAQLDPLAAKLASRLGAPPPAHTRLAEVMTNSLEAYRLYSLGLERTRAMRLPEAISLYEKAVELDPAFAMAYARIGYTYSVSWATPAKGKPYLEKAYRLSERLTSRDRLFIRAWYLFSCEDFEGAEKAYREILASFPAETEVYLSLANMLIGDRRTEEAGQILERGLALEPDMPDLHNLLSTASVALGRREQAIDSARRYVALSGEANAYDTLGAVYQAFGRYQESEDAYLESLRKKPDFEIAIIHLGNLYFQLGRYRDAIEEYRRYIQIAPSDTERIRGHASLSWVHARKQDWRNAEAEASEAERIAAHPVLESMLIGYDAGTHELSETMRRQIFGSPQPRVMRGSRANNRLPYFLAGHIALRERRTDEALDYFRAALREPPLYWYIDPLETCLADALLELERFDDAIAEYRRILTGNENYPMARYRLAIALERKGSAREALAEFGRFRAVWKDADSDVPENVEVRRRMANPSAGHKERSALPNHA